jgi:hypothetical protein
VVRPRQVNIRVPAEAHDVLEAAVYVRRLRGMQDLLAPLVEQAVDELQRDEAIQVVVAARRSANGKG